MRLIFMGTPDFAVPALRALSTAGHEIAAVYTQPPRPAGRGKKPRPSPVAMAAAELGLAVYSPTSLREAETIAELRAHQADLAVVVAYGLILPEAVLSVPPRGSVNIHASLLPSWRGAAPIQRAIMAGDTQTGISIMQMDRGLDTGDVLLRSAIPIHEAETAGVLQNRLSQLGAELICDALARLDGLAAIPQPTEGASYAAKIDKAEARIDWTRDATHIARQINGLSPFPGAWTEAHGERLKLLSARPLSAPGEKGRLLSGDGFRIGCGQGSVEIITAQRAGRAAQDASDFLRGAGLATGERFDT